MEILPPIKKGGGIIEDNDGGILAPILNKAESCVGADIIRRSLKYGVGAADDFVRYGIPDVPYAIPITILGIDIITHKFDNGGG